MSKKEFIAVLEQTLICANLGVLGLSLIDNNHVEITFRGNSTKTVNITGDSYGAIIIDVMKYAF